LDPFITFICYSSDQVLFNYKSYYYALLPTLAHLFKTITNLNKIEELKKMNLLVLTDEKK